MKKQKDISKEEYIAEFCREKRIRNRAVIYVSEEMHRKIKRTVAMFRENYISVSSYAERIFEHHFSTHANLLNNIREEQHREFLELGKDKQDNYESDE